MTTHAQAPPARLPVAGLWLWTAWVAMTLVGALVGLLLTGALGALLIPFGPASLVRGWEWVTVPLFVVGAGVLLWLPMGITQGLVLRRVIAGFGWTGVGRWVRTTALAGAGAMALSALVFGLYLLLALGMGENGYIGSAGGNCLAFVFPILIGAGIGAVFGLSQSAVFGRYVFAPEAWLKTSLVGWGVIMPLGLLLVGLILRTLTVMAIIPMMGMMPTLHPSNLLAGALVMTLPATVTGLALPRLMSVPTHEPPEPLPLPWRPRLSLPRHRPGPDLPRLFPK